jgi:hypothetical protein
MVITLRAKVGCFLKGDFLLAINPICLYSLVPAPAAAVYYHVERAISIKGKGQIPQGFAFIVPTFFGAVTAGHTLSLLKLNYFSHFPFSRPLKVTRHKACCRFYSNDKKGG